MSLISLRRQIMEILDQCDPLGASREQITDEICDAISMEVPVTDPRYMRPGLDFAMGKAIEEAGEFLAAMGKTMRWGWSSVNPELPPAERESNQMWVRREIQDLRGALDNLEREMEILR